MGRRVILHLLRQLRPSNCTLHFHFVCKIALDTSNLSQHSIMTKFGGQGPRRGGERGKKNFLFFSCVFFLLLLFFFLSFHLSIQFSLHFNFMFLVLHLVSPSVSVLFVFLSFPLFRFHMASTAPISSYPSLLPKETSTRQREPKQQPPQPKGKQSNNHKQWGKGSFVT